MKRREDWPQRLECYLREARGAEFEWGVRDCVLFAAGAVAAMTGKDPAEHVRGKYAGEISAARLLRRKAPAGLGAAIGAALKTAPIAPAFAGRGDVVLIEGENYELAVGIVDLRGTTAVTVGKEGLVCRPLSMAIAAWRV